MGGRVGGVVPLVVPTNGRPGFGGVAQGCSQGCSDTPTPYIFGGERNAVLPFGRYPPDQKTRRQKKDRTPLSHDTS